MFKINDYVVYPGHGVSKVTRIEARHVGSAEATCYILNTLNDITIMVPIKDADKTGVRPVITKTKAKQVLQYLGASEVFQGHSDTWNKRYREYMELLKSGSIDDIAKVYKSLVNLKGNSDLSFGARKMLDRAKTLLISEIGLALELEEPETIGLLDIVEKMHYFKPIFKNTEEFNKVKEFLVKL